MTARQDPDRESTPQEIITQLKRDVKTAEMETKIFEKALTEVLIHLKKYHPKAKHKGVSIMTVVQETLAK